MDGGDWSFAQINSMPRMDNFSPTSLAVGGVVVLITTFGLFKVMSSSSKEVENSASSEGVPKKEKTKTQIVSYALYNPSIFQCFLHWPF